MIIGEEGLTNGYDGFLILIMLVGIGLYLHLTFRNKTRAEIEDYFLNWK